MTHKGGFLLLLTLPQIKDASIRMRGWNTEVPQVKNAPVASLRRFWMCSRKDAVNPKTKQNQTK